MQTPLRLGIAGLGTVGTGLLDVLKQNGALLSGQSGRDIVVTGVCARTKSTERGGHSLAEYRWFDDAGDLAAWDEIDVFVELIGGDSGPALDSVETALRSAKHVVTANKAMIAHHGTRLAKLAESNGVSLQFEAAIAGGIPIVKVVRESLAGNNITRVYGIMNGTCNYILTEMDKERRDFADVLATAQELGYAETDPSFDVGGIDAAHKIACLTSLAFGVETSFESIFIEGIEDITLSDIQNAAELGYKIKLMAVAVQTDEGIEQRVHPTLVPKGSPIAEVDGVFNAVGLSGDFVHDILMHGKGAGGHPTASSVISDIVDIARGSKMPVYGLPATQLKPYTRAPMRAHEGGYYVAMDLYDKPGTVAFIAQTFSDENISIESILQRSPATNAIEEANDELKPFIMISHDTMESRMRAALTKISETDHCAGQPKMIRIERF